MTTDAPVPASAPLRLGLFYGAVFLALGIYGPFWPLWLKAQGLSPEQIGLVFALGTLAKVTVNPFAARAADRSGRRKRLLVGLTLAAAIAFALFAVTESLAAILLVSVLYFVCWGPIMPLTESLTMLTRARRPFDYGRVRLWGSVTFIAGAYGMGLVLTDASVAWTHGAILGAVVLAFLAALALPDTPAPPAEPGSRPFREVLRLPGLMAAVLAATCVQASHSVYYGFSSLHWRNAGHGPDVIGALWAEGVIVEILLFACAAAAVRRVGALNLILLGSAAAVLRWLVTGETTDLAWLAVVQALHALTFGATHLGIIHLIAERASPALSATAQSTYAMALGLGSAAVTCGAGWLFAALQGGAFLAMAGLAFAGIVFGGIAYLADSRSALSR